MTIHCDNCDTPIPEFTTRQIEDDLFEVGLDCVNCHRWYHSYYMDRWLKDNVPGQLADRKVRMKYGKRLRKFQNSVRRTNQQKNTEQATQSVH